MYDKVRDAKVLKIVDRSVVVGFKCEEERVMKGQLKKVYNVEVSRCKSGRNLQRRQSGCYELRNLLIGNELVKDWDGVNVRRLHLEGKKRFVKEYFDEIVPLSSIILYNASILS